MNQETISKNALLYCRIRYSQYSMYEAYAKKYGSSYKSLFVLRQLYANPEGLTQIEICQDSLISKQTVSAVVKRFYEKKYVYMEEISSDRRNKLVKLTPKGVEYAKEIIQPIIEAEKESMACFSEEEQRLFIKMCTKYTDVIKDRIDNI